MEGETNDPAVALGVIAVLALMQAACVGAGAADPDPT
jgi:hypothetical protein